MPTRKIEEDDYEAQRPCTSSEHGPPTMQVFEPGLYEHECPRCGKKTVFRVRRAVLTSRWSSRWSERA